MAFDTNTVRHMPNQSPALDRIFKALADPTRRAVIEALRRGPASTSELARPFGMALPSFAQHLDTLEDCGLVRSRKTGRVRTYRLSATSLTKASRWLDAQREQWEGRLDRFDQFVVKTHSKG